MHAATNAIVRTTSGWYIELVQLGASPSAANGAMRYLLYTPSGTVNPGVDCVGARDLLMH
jgi:hypothetical protein